MTSTVPAPVRPVNGSAHFVHHLDVMGTVVTIDVYGEPSLSASRTSLLIERACTSLREADDVFSTWKADSPMSRLRRGEITVSMAPPQVAEVLELCATARERSGGWFDPWAVPGGVDPTGYVKGWAAQRALAALEDPAVTGAIVNAAGDIASIGGLSQSQGFRFGIVNPFATREVLCVVNGAAALATSGTYERGLHLIDPHTGSAETKVASASVTGPDLGLADALATAVAVAGEVGLTMIDDIDGYDAMIVTPEGAMRWTAGFPIESI
jgi:thiamine biosynthesis lipoprotein